MGGIAMCGGRRRTGRPRFSASGCVRIFKSNTEGIDTKSVRPDASARATLPDGTKVSAGDEILTFVNRNMRALPRISYFHARPTGNPLQETAGASLITGMDNDSAYGNRPRDAKTWRGKLLRKVRRKLRPFSCISSASCPSRPI
jgi:hypothetical protein